MEYKIIHFSKERYKSYCSYLKEFSNKNYNTSDFIADKWWAEDSPGTSYLLLAYVPNEIAARCVISGRQLTYHNEPVDCFEIGGTFTLPQHQRRGLFTRLVKKAVELGFRTEARLIYGTPNDRSGPGYRKLKFSFIDQENSYFILLLTSLNLFRRKVGFLKKEIVMINKEGEHTPLFKNIKVAEISHEAYFHATKSFHRMNHVDDTYLQRRFDVDNLNNSTRRFFHGSGKAADFYCAICCYDLSFMKLLLVSEYYLNGVLDTSSKEFSFLRAIASGFYKNYDAIYLKASFPSVSRTLYSVQNMLCVHRKLPICYTVNPKFDREQIDDMMRNIVDVFQLTDCDIG